MLPRISWKRVDTFFVVTSLYFHDLKFAFLSNESETPIQYSPKINSMQVFGVNVAAACCREI